MYFKASMFLIKPSGISAAQPTFLRIIQILARTGHKHFRREQQPLQDKIFPLVFSSPRESLGPWLSSPWFALLDAVQEDGRTWY